MLTDQTIPVYGLTGGIGSGKSTVAHLFQQLFVICVVDADKESRSLTASGGLAIEAIREEFGAALIDSSGALDRRQMRELVFSNSSVKKRLENILHPLILTAIESKINTHRKAGAPAILVDIPLLVESSHWRKRLNSVIVVDCAPTEQIKRVMARSGLTEQEVTSMMAAQATRQTRLEAADLVIHNSHISLEALQTLSQRAGQRLDLCSR